MHSVQYCTVQYYYCMYPEHSRVPFLLLCSTLICEHSLCMASGGLAYQSLFAPTAAAKCANGRDMFHPLPLSDF